MKFKTGDVITYAARLRLILMADSKRRQYLTLIVDGIVSEKYKFRVTSFGRQYIEKNYRNLE